MYFVYSTLTADNSYCTYLPGPEKGAQPIGEKVLIKGGANVAAKFSVTPVGQPNNTMPGVITEITEHQLAICEACAVFRRQRDRGFLVVVKKEEKLHTIVDSMEKKDKGAPKTPSDYENVRKEDGKEIITVKAGKR